MSTQLRFKSSKVIFSLIVFIALVFSVYLVSEGSNFFTKNKDMIPDHINKISSEYGIDVHVKNEKILLTNNVSPNKQGNEAIINDPQGKGFVIVDPQGNVADDLQDLHKEMESMKVNKGSKQVPAFLSAANFFGENSLVFLSNYTENDPRANLWLLDLKTREFKKLFDASTFGDMFFEYVSQEKLILWTQKEDVYYLVYPDKSYEEININGDIESISPDGNIIAYRQFKEGVTMENGIRFLDLTEKSNSIQPEIDTSYRYNAGPTWNESGDKFASLIQNVENGELQILVFDFTTQGTILIHSEDKSFTTHSSLQFIEDNIIQAELEDGTEVQYSIN